VRILITGGAGFIGSWLVPELLNSGHSLVVIDNLSPQIHGQIPDSTYPWLNLGPEVTFIRGDIRDRGMVDSALDRCDAVIHLAAETGTGQSMYQISHYYDVNQNATAKMLEMIVLRHKKIKHFILASSRSIYGEGAYLAPSDIVVVPLPRDPARMRAGFFEPLGENQEKLKLVATPESVMPSPSSIYAATKLANETMGKIVSTAFDLKFVALRFQNVYGEGQSLKNPYTGILSIFSNRMRQGLPVNIYEDGLESRDFVHVSDVVRSIQSALNADISGFCAVNIGSGIATTVLSAAELMKNYLKSESPLNISGDFRVGDIRHCYAELSKAKELLNYSPIISFENGLKKFIEWVLKQPVQQDLSEMASIKLADLGLGKSLTPAND
jgi:dTDP-L-rhamnose 4-epimerase